MASITTTSPTTANQTEGRSYRAPFAIMTSLFFLWGFMTVFNDILIPRFREAFTLDYFHAMLVQLAFFGAYFIGSLLYFLVSATTGDPIAKIGYKNGVVIGLLISATGSAFFWPAAVRSPQSATIAPGDIQNVRALSEQLIHPTNAISIFVSGKLTDQTRQLLASGANVDEQKLKQALAEDLNALAKGSVIYEPQRFAGVNLNDTTKDLIEKWNGGQLKESAALNLFNRALLEDSYPQEVNKNLVPYWFFLVSLFIVGIGFAMLQIAANPYVTILGPEKTASSRLNLAQGFNSIGTTIGPLIGGFLIFQYFATTGAHGAESVKVPYMAFCVIFLVLAAVFFFIRLPHVGEGHVEPGAGALKYPHVVLGVIAIFMYVGGEVSVGSAIINFLGQKSVAGLTADEASKYVAIYWGGLMIGRFMGAVELSEMKAAKKQLLLFIIPLLAWLFLWAAKSAPLDAMQNGLNASVFRKWSDNIVENWPVFRTYLPFVGLCWLLFQFGKSLAGRTLFIFSIAVVCLLITAIFVGGKTAMWCVVAVGLFTSVGWSNTFSLALEGTGIYKSQVSSLLVMAILGGALLPPLMGKIADVTHNLQVAFIVPLVAYAYVAFYGAKGHSIGRKQVAA
jgi:FHS family L-fucose permease-like MFS transporter